MALALEAAKPEVVILEWIFNDVEPANERRPKSINLSGSSHHFVQLHSALYVVADLGFKQLQADVGLVRSSDSCFGRFADPEGAPALAARARLEAVLNLPAEAGLPCGIILWPAVVDRSFTDHAALFEGVLSACAERSIPCLDLRPALALAPSDPSLVVSIYDRHPNGLAHKLVVDAVLPWLELLVSEMLERDRPRLQVRSALRLCSE